MRFDAWISVPVQAAVNAGVQVVSFPPVPPSQCRRRSPPDAAVAARAEEDAGGHCQRQPTALWNGAPCFVDHPRPPIAKRRPPACRGSRIFAAVIAAAFRRPSRRGDAFS
jgi:hypothetical protein